MEQSELRFYVREAFKHMDNAVKHPSMLQIAEVAGGASEAESENVRRHLSTCDHCQQLLLEFEQFEADCKHSSTRNLDQEWREFRQRSRWYGRVIARPRWGSIAAGIVIAFGLAWFAMKEIKPNAEARTISAPAVTLSSHAVPRGGSQGNALFVSNGSSQGGSSTARPPTRNNERTIEFRLPDREHAPLRNGDNPALDLSKGQSKAPAPPLAETEVVSGDPAEVLRIRGEVELMAGRAAAALRILYKALSLRPRDSRLLTDLGVAFAVRGDIERSQLCAHIPPGQFVSPISAQGEGGLVSYSTALKLLTLSVDLAAAPDAIFDRALVLERMQRNSEAAMEWKRYLLLDSTSGWAEEARHRPANLPKCDFQTGLASDHWSKWPTINGTRP